MAGCKDKISENERHYPTATSVPPPPLLFEGC